MQLDSRKYIVESTQKNFEVKIEVLKLYNTDNFASYVHQFVFIDLWCNKFVFFFWVNAVLDLKNLANIRNCAIIQFFLKQLKKQKKVDFNFVYT